MTEELMNNFRKNCLKYEERNSYIKILLCEVLGYSDDHMYNHMIGLFYDNYLRQYQLSMLIDEFKISPILESKLVRMSDEERIKLAKNIESFVKPIAHCVLNQDYQSASFAFMCMNDYLRKTIDMSDLMVSEKVNEVGEDKIMIKTLFNK